MTAQVRLFTHPGVVSVPIGNSQLAVSDAAFVLLKQPWLAREALEADSVAVDSAPATAPAGTTCLAVEVETQKTIGYEVSPLGFPTRVADTNSPRMTGRQIIQFGEGWVLSVIEIT